MGTTSIKQSMAETRKMLLREFNFNKDAQNYSNVLASARGKGGFWILRDMSNAEDGVVLSGITATFIKMNFFSGETFYKEIDIEWHPRAYDCPAGWLEQIKVHCEGGMEWMTKARKYHLSLQKDLSGFKFTMAGVSMAVIEPMTGIWWKIYDESRGSYHKMRDSMIREYLV